MIVTTDMLGTSPFGQSRIIINTNIDAIATEVNNIETIFGISLPSGNMDFTANTGGILKANQVLSGYIQLPASGTSAITIDGSTGNISCNLIVATTSLTAPALTVTNLTVAVSGSATFNSPASFLQIAEFLDGYSRGPALDLGIITAHTVLNSDNVLIFDAAAAQAVTLTADPSLVDGHEITLVYKGTNSGVTIPPANLMGSLTASFTNIAYKSSVTLVYSLSNNKWLVTGAVNVTVA